LDKKGLVLVEKFKIKKKQEEVVFRNIRFSKKLFDKINEEKGKISFTQFVLQACTYALENLDKSE